MQDIILEKHDNFAEAPEKEKKRTAKSKFSGSNFFTYWFNLLSAILIVFALLGTDFVLFSGSGTFGLFENGGSLRPEVLYILIALAVIVVVTCFFFSVLNVLLNLLMAMSVYLFSIALFRQFANFNIDASAGWQSANYISVVLAAISFVVLIFTKKTTRALLCILAVGCFLIILFRQDVRQPDFLITEEGENVGDEKGKNFIYIMLPNAPSYSYISSLKDNEAGAESRQKLMSVMLGFYAKNGFRIYPNAYVTDNNQFVNAARALNYSSEKISDDLQTSITKNDRRQLNTTKDYEVYLKNNKIFDYLKQEDYKISTYQTRGINLCQQDNVFRCVNKHNFPANLDKLNLSKIEKAGILAAQWLESTGWFEQSRDWLYDHIKPVYNPDSLPLLGISYKNLYVLNAMETIDILAENLAKDRGNNAYFVYMDLPADMYVYDDQCRLKHPDEWVAKKDLSSADNRNQKLQHDAYLKQSMCLYGKLEQFMQSLKKSGQLEKTTIIIQGLSGMDDNSRKDKQNLAEDFMNAKMTTMAIKNPESRQLIINKSVCPIENILSSYFKQEKKCKEFEKADLSKTTKESVKKAVSGVKFNSNSAQRAVQAFHDWYKQWHKNNYKTEKTVAEPVKNMEKQPQLRPLEEKEVTTQKIMQNVIQDVPEEKVESLSKTVGATGE